MRAKLFVVLESVFLGLGMLILTPSANPTAVGKAGSPSPNSTPPPIGFARKPQITQPAQTAGDLGVHHQLVWWRF